MRRPNIKTSKLSRRFMLRGAGASVALPLLDAMRPKTRLAHADSFRAPQRWVMWHFPTGYRENKWSVAGEGNGETDWELSPTLEPLGELGLKQDVTVVQGLRAPYADGPGASHTCGLSGQLSGFLCPHEVSENHRTIDQEIADQISGDTRVRSLQLGTSILHENPNDEPGYSANIKDHLSWQDSLTPLPKQIDPAAVFERLFGEEIAAVDDDDVAFQRRQRMRQSILDAVLTEADALSPRLGTADRQKLDQYLGNLREIERGIQDSPRNNESGMCDIQGRVGSFHAPDDIEDHVRQMNSLMLLALQCDITRVIVFQYETTVTPIRHPFLNVNAPYHLGVAHHNNDPEKLIDYTIVNRWLVRQFGEFALSLKESEEADGSTLLDNCAVIMTSELGDGSAHLHTNLPCLVAGSAGGNLVPGRFLRRTNEQFMRLLTGTAQAVGADIEGWGLDYTQSQDPDVEIRGTLPGLLD
jgi:hypothetical protein